MKNTKIRARLLETKEWATGYLMQTKTTAHIVTDDDETNPKPIDPETISFATGKTYRDGTMAFENDIIDYKGGVGIICYGEFNMKHVGFYVKWLGRTHDYRNDILYWIPIVTCIGNAQDENDRIKFEIKH